jgi:hypothetical protein
MSKDLRMTRRQFGTMLGASISMASKDALSLIKLKPTNGEKLCFSYGEIDQQNTRKIIFVHCETTGWLTMPLILDANLHLQAELIDRGSDYVGLDWWRDCREISSDLDPLLMRSNPWVILTIDLDDKQAVPIAHEVINFFKFKNGLKVGVLASSHPAKLRKHDKGLKALTDVLCQEVVELVIPRAQRIAEDRYWGEEHCTASFAIADRIDQHGMYDVFERRWQRRT